MDKLNDVQAARNQYGDSDNHVRDKALSLIDDVNKWLGERRLDATIGADAKRLLAPFA
jgi:hypothetical protein